MIQQAFNKAESEQISFINTLVEYNKNILKHAGGGETLTVMLAGRPYHTDSLIQHKVSDMLSDMGVNVIMDDWVRHLDIPVDDAHFVAQWAYTNRILSSEMVRNTRTECSVCRNDVIRVWSGCLSGR